MGIWVAGPLMSLVDTAAVGRVCATQLAALGPACCIADQSFNALTFIGFATTALHAKSVTKRNAHETRTVSSDAVTVAAVSGVALVCAMQAAGPSILASFVGGTQKAIYAPALKYCSAGRLW